MLQKFALGYYLRQNLLQFLFTPKYAENREEGQFRDYTEIKFPVIKEEDVFLYNRPQQSGGKGKGNNLWSVFPWLEFTRKKILLFWQESLIAQNVLFFQNVLTFFTKFKLF